MTRYYDSLLTASGLRVTQFIVLVGVVRGLGTTLTKLSKALGMDRSSLSRNLRPLLRDGLVEVIPATDRRRRALHVTKVGERQLARSIPAWRQAQEHVLATVGGEKWQALGFELQSLAKAVRTKPEDRRGPEED